jgi:hypothetical protein
LAAAILGVVALVIAISALRDCAAATGALLHALACQREEPEDLEIISPEPEPVAASAPWTLGSAPAYDSENGHEGTYESENGRDGRHSDNGHDGIPSSSPVADLPSRPQVARFSKPE